MEDKEDLILEIQLADFSGRIWKKEKIRTAVGRNRAVKVYETMLSKWIPKERGKDCYWQLLLKDRSGKLLAEKHHFFYPPKELHLPVARVRHTVKLADGKCKVILKTDQLAKDVFVEVPVQGTRFSDNFFDLLPGEKRVITMESPVFRKGMVPMVKVRHLRETYN